MIVKRYPELTSTSTQAAALGDAAAHGTVVVTDCQTAGRGQRGNKWEAEPGANLTFSIVLRPQSQPARTQYMLSMAMAIAICDVLQDMLPDRQVRIKWPNDIYVGDRKISGTIIECSVGADAMVQRAIAGIGINVNQTVFVSDAPNPVSLAQLTGRHYELEPLLQTLASAIIAAVDSLSQQTSLTPNPSPLTLEYFNRMWRADGRAYQWRDNLTGELMTASIHSVATDGRLTLALDDTTHRHYYFKELSPIL